MTRQVRPTWAEIDLGVLAANVRALKACAGRAALMAVVKADAYGHGAVQVALRAREAGAEWLGVAIPEEGFALRRAGVDGPILVLGWTPPGQAAAVVEEGLAATVSSLEGAKAFSRVADAGLEARVHLKVDTGMGRLGILPGPAGREEALAILNLRGVRVEGIYTHFATADDADKTFALRQLEVFLDFVEELGRYGATFAMRHAANSAALLDLPQSHLDMVRPGLALYGYLPSPHVSRKVPLRPPLSWKTRVSHVKRLPAGSSVGYGATFRTTRPTMVATLPVGYADGYPRLLSNNAEVLVGGRRCPVIGRVCMDQMMVEVPDALKVSVGEEVVLLGSQGAQTVDADELAGRAGTIAHEILTGLSPRVPRVYLH